MTKKKQLPKNLYRFKSIETTIQLIYVINEITKGELYLSRPEDFNDIFDAMSVLSKDNMYDYFKDSPDIDYIIELVKYVNKVYGKTSVRKNAGILKDLSMNFWIDMNNHYNQTMRQMRIACFTECLNSMPMWAHYANDHQGVCLLYDTTTFTDSIHRTRLFPVEYTKQIPDMILEETVKSKAVKFKSLESCVTKKHEDWSYEKEWRLIYHQGFFYSKEEDVPEEFYESGKVINFYKPSKVYLGYKVKVQVENFIREIVEALGIDVVKMESTVFGLVPKKG